MSVPHRGSLAKPPAIAWTAPFNFLLALKRFNSSTVSAKCCFGILSRSCSIQNNFPHKTYAKYKKQKHNTLTQFKSRNWIYEVFAVCFFDFVCENSIWFLGFELENSTQPNLSKQIKLPTVITTIDPCNNGKRKVSMPFCFNGKSKQIEQFTFSQCDIQNCKIEHRINFGFLYSRQNIVINLFRRR